MAKTKTPFLSLASRGTVGQVLTSQKRGSSTLLREKPLPAYRRTLPQQYQRWLYEDYAYLWTKQTEATRRQYATKGSRWHLTAFQYWMKEYLKTKPDIVAWYKLDEKAGAIARDSSPNQKHATIYGASFADMAINGALDFDGINDYLRVPDGVHDFTNLVFTVEYFTTPEKGGEIYVVSKLIGAGLFQGYRFGFANGLYRFYLDDGPNLVEFTGAIDYRDGQIHHFLYAGDGANVLVYVDGDFIASHDCSSIGDMTTTQQLIIGATYDGAFRNHEGPIDNVLILNRTEDATEAKRHSERRYPS